MKKLLVAIFTVCLFPVVGNAAGRVECSAVRSKVLGRQVRYCALLPPSYDKEKTRRYPVLYYLHGLGDNERSLVNLGGWNLVENLQDSGRIGEFLIITPDGGRSFYVNSRDAKQPYEDFFMREFIPAMETKYRIRAARATRGISGVSMGGYGALHFAFKFPQMFVSVSAHMAALFERIPPGLANARGMGSRFDFMGEVFGRPLDRAFWDRNSPFTLAQQGKGISTLKIYFDCGRNDDYGFDTGAQALHDLLKSRGVPHDFSLHPGRHDWFYIADRLPASMEFHSRVFGLISTAKK